VKLDTLFKVAVNSEDLWPTQPSEPSGEPGMEWEPLESGFYQVNKIVRFDYFWTFFGEHEVTSVNLKSNNENVALLWCQSGGPSQSWSYDVSEVHIKNSYAFTGDPEPYGYPEQIQKPDWGDCLIKIAYKRGKYKWLESEDVASVPNRPEKFGPVWTSKTSKIGLFYPEDGKHLITWRNPDSWLFVAEVETSRWARLLTRFRWPDLSQSGPCVHYIVDELENENIVFAVLSPDYDQTPKTKVLYLSSDDQSWIKNWDDLPK
jgi:hypothetical protein